MEYAAPKETLIQIEPGVISSSALLGIIESFILREGTDYGSVEISLEKKVEQVKKQIASKEIIICFDQTSQSVNLLSKNEFKKLQPGTSG